jgi:hypothetical protein
MENISRFNCSGEISHKFSLDCEKLKQHDQFSHRGFFYCETNIQIKVKDMFFVDRCKISLSLIYNADFLKTY